MIFHYCIFFLEEKQEISDFYYSYIIMPPAKEIYFFFKKNIKLNLKNKIIFNIMNNTAKRKEFKEVNCFYFLTILFDFKFEISLFIQYIFRLKDEFVEIEEKNNKEKINLEVEVKLKFNSSFYFFYIRSYRHIVTVFFKLNVTFRNKSMVT